jgi:hypothetical protein
MRVKLRRLHYRSLKGRISYLIIHLAKVIDFIVVFLSLGYFTIDFAESLIFDCKWIDD